MAKGEVERVEKLPDSVWDEYVGQHVCLQLSAEYLSVTAPGTFARVNTPQGAQFLRLPIMQGIFNLKKDKRGELRVTMTMPDPNENTNGFVRADIDPSYIFACSVVGNPPAEEEQPKSIIVTP